MLLAEALAEKDIPSFASERMEENVRQAKSTSKMCSCR